MKMCLSSLFVAAVIFSSSAQKAPSMPACRRPLVVSLYPSIPDAVSFYYALEQAFEAKYPAIDLTIRTVSADTYYDPSSGILTAKADVYEIDCIMLDDFIQAKKIQPFPPTYQVNRADFLPGAEIVYKGTKLYAVPHWLCANFLLYNSTDQALKETNSFAQLATHLSNPDSLRKGLAIDEYGKLTVGELYVGALYDVLGDMKKVLPYCQPENINPTAVQLLNQVPNLTYKTWGRDKAYHDKEGFYAKQYGIGNARGFVGYSESLYTILEQAQNACMREQQCVSSATVGIKLWTFSEANPTTIGWVDALALDTELKGQKLKDAQQFVGFLTGKEIYRLALRPAPYMPPRYLLPPYSSCYTDTAITNQAPLYQQLYPLAKQIRTCTQTGLTKSLRDIGKKLTDSLNH